MTEPKRITKGELRNYQVSIMGDKDKDRMTGMILGANAQLEVDIKAHHIIIRELFDWIEKARTTPLGHDQYGSYLWDEDVKAKRQKYLA